MKLFFLYIMSLLTLPLAAEQTGPDVVILRNDARFTVKDKTHATYSKTIEMQINDKGKGYADFFCSVNNGSTKLKSFSGEIKDATGKVVKIKKSDLRYTEYSEGLADSYGTWYYSPTILYYPATVTYSFEKQYSDAILGYDPFVPMPFDENAMTENASYTLTVPKADCFSYRQLNIPGVAPEHTSTKDGEVFAWKVKKLPPLKAERNSPPLSSIMPVVLFTPKEFSYEGKEGSASDWKSIGDWLLSLTEGYDTPPADLEAKVRQLTEGAGDNLEKIRRVYEYLGETTRYVSIQLGLGGLRPIPPENVFKNKFGDCKALSFYMQTMLKCCGIDSYYVIINMGEDRLIPDFPSLGTTNHAILAVPMEKDTLWLECTNPEVPLGYVHPEIAGNHALIVKKGESHIVRLPKEPDESNEDYIDAVVDLLADGSAMASVTETSRMDFWSDLHELAKIPIDKRVNEIVSRINLPRGIVSDVKINSAPSPEPSCKMTYKAEAATYASVTGSRLFVPVNPFRDVRDNTSSTKRTNDLYFRDGCVLTDTIVLNVPEGYSVEAYPKDFEFDNEFGSIVFKESRKTIDGHLRFTFLYKIEKKSGTFPNTSYNAYRAFRKAAAWIYGTKLVLVKK